MTTRTIPRISVESRHPAQEDLGYLGELFVDGPRIFACGGTYNRTTLLLSTDGGTTFEQRPTPRTPGLRRLARVDELLVVTGEHGTLALSDDLGLTWTPIPLPTESCIFGFAVDRDGQRLVIGDGGFVARAPRGTWDFTKVESDTETRLLAFARVGDRLFVLGYDGSLRAWNGQGLDAPVFSCGKALTALAVTPSGAWILTADGGGIFRSEDGGRTFAQVPSPRTEDLEHVHADARGVFIVGGEGTLLFSDDDGRSFVPVETAVEGHLWCIAPAGGSYLVSGDSGGIFAMSVSATEKVTVDFELPAAEQTEEEEQEDEAEEQEEEEEHENEDDEAAAAESAAPAFASVEEASSRWTREGRAFMTALNGYLDRIYSVGINKAGKEPTDTRADMADYVREQLAAFNARGEHQKARALFPPAYEPFEYEGMGRSVNQVARLLDGRILAQIENEVHVLERDAISPALEGVHFFALSPDRRLVGLAYDDRMDVHEGLGGKKVRSLPFPAVSVIFAAKTAQLTPEGDGCLVTTEDGVRWIGERGVKPLMPDSLEADAPHYLHGAMSPNGRFVAIGCQDSSHILIDRKTGSRHAYNTVSSYPHFALFHRDRPEVVFNSVHGLYGSGSLAVSLDGVLSGKSDSARVLDRRAWVFSGASLGDGWLLGDRGGYVWCLDGDGKQKWYLFLGSSLTSMDVSPDERTLLVGSIAGYVVEIDLTAAARDPMLLTNGNVKESARWVFWHGHDPMLW